MTKRIEPVSHEHTDEHGVRRVVGSDGETWMRTEDLARWLLSLDPAGSNDPAKREAIARFQREAGPMQPAAQHRRALELLAEMGCNNTSDPHLQLRPKAVP